MKISIIPGDSMVTVDGRGFAVDLSGLPETIHAVQFDTETSTGHVEFVDDAEVNQDITSLGSYQAAVDSWQVAADYADAKAADPFYDTTVEEAKSLKVSQILSALGFKKLEAYDDGVNQLSPYGTQTIEELEALALMVRAEGDTTWTTDVILDDLEPDGTQSRVTLTAAQIITKIRGLRQRNENLNQVAQGHIDAVTLLTTVAEIRDYELPI